MVQSKIYGKVGFTLLGQQTYKGAANVGGEFTFFFMSWEPEKLA